MALGFCQLFGGQRTERVFPGSKRCRESRSYRQVATEASGFNPHERFFTEGTSTVDLSSSGCRFHLRSKVAKDSVVAIGLLHGSHGLEPDSRTDAFPDRLG
jgi:hypothetical protein